MKRFLLPALLSALMIAEVHAESFTVSDIRVNGLQRVSAGSVFAALPLNVGETIDDQALVQATRSLFKTGFFQDIQLGRDGNVLVVTVVERPSISSIEIEGNKAISKEDLLKGLKQSGLAEGEIFQRATLEGVRNELQRQYVAQGRYSAEINAEVIPQPRNRVALKININEGTVAAISHINVVGNTVFSEEDLTDLSRTEDYQLAVVLQERRQVRPRKALRRPRAPALLLPGPRLHQHGYRLHPGIHHPGQEARLHHRQHQRG